MHESSFFTNIAARLGRCAPLADAPSRTVRGAPDFWKVSMADGEDKVKTFKRELEALGGEGHVLDDTCALHDALDAQLAKFNPQCIGYWGGGLINQYGLENILSSYDVVEWGTHGVEEYQTVDISISGCAYAVSDTGTVVMMSNAERGRSVAVLPAIHIVIVHQSQIRYRLGEVLTEVAQRRSDLPSSIHFISGPSRSSDIENDQTIGIHGPGAVIAYILRS